VHRPEFEWCAAIAPFGFISVIDAIAADKPRLEVLAFDRIRFATINSGATSLVWHRGKSSARLLR